MTTSKIKKSIIIGIAICLLAVMLAFTLAGCAYKHKAVEGGQPNADTESNTGMVVKQGDYIYFINGVVKDTDILKEKDNKYGEIVEGGIYRAKLDGSDIQCIVPQVSYTAYASGGLSVFGEYLYYTSPKVTTSKTGTLVTTFLEYCRVRIDGTDRKIIATIDGMSTEYKFTDKGLFYKENNELKYINYDNGSNTTIDKDISAIYFPKTVNYSPTNGSPSDVVIYTKSAEEDHDRYSKFNRLFVAMSNGETKEITEGKEDATRTLKHAQVENGKLVIYYEKSEYINNDSTSEDRGLRASELTADYKLGEERQMTKASGGTYIYAPNAYTRGVFISSGNELKIEYVAGTKLATAYVWDFTYAVPTINTFDGNKIYFVKDSDLYSVEMLATGKDITANESSIAYYGFQAVPTLIMTGNISSNGLAPEIIGGNFYYYDSARYDYLYIKNINQGKRKFVGVHSEADKKAYETFVKDLNKVGQEETKTDYEKEYDYIY